MPAPNSFIPPQMDPQLLTKMGIQNPFAPPQPPPPSAPQGFQVWASAPENAIKVAPFMTQPNQPMQPAAAHPPAPKMASVNPPAGGQPMSEGLGLPANTAYQTLGIGRPEMLGSIRSAAAAPPDMTPDLTAPVNLPNAAPPVMRTAQPNVQSQAQAKLQKDLQTLQDFQTQGAGPDRIQTPWVRTGAKILDALGTAISPGLMMAVPHSTMNDRLRENWQQGRVTADQQALNDQIDNIFKQAQAQALLNPRDKYQFLQTPKGYVAANPADATTMPLLDNQGNALMPPAAETEHWTLSPEYTGPNGEPVEVEQNSGQMRIAQNATAFKRVPKAGEGKETSPQQQAFDAYIKSGMTPMQAYEKIREKPVTPGTDVGTWQLGEDATGKPTLWNSKTGAQRDAGGIQRAGTFAKAHAADAGEEQAINYANDYMTNGVFTGPGDEALQEKFFELAKPKTGFRMSQPQMDMLQNSRDWMSSVSAKVRHARTGTWFAPDQRQQIVDTMQQLAKARAGSTGNTAQGGTANNSPASGGVQVFTDNGVTYHIPSDKVTEFRRDHPNATR